MNDKIVTLVVEITVRDEDANELKETLQDSLEQIDIPLYYRISEKEPNQKDSDEFEEAYGD